MIEAASPEAAVAVLAHLLLCDDKPPYCYVSYGKTCYSVGRYVIEQPVEQPPAPAGRILNEEQL